MKAMGKELQKALLTIDANCMRIALLEGEKLDLQNTIAGMLEELRVLRKQGGKARG